MKQYRFGVYMFSLMLMVAFCAFQKSAIYATTEGKIWFRSEAAKELIKASSDELVGLLDISKNNFAFKINMRSFKGFNSALQREHFNENYIETDKYPEAAFKGKIIEDVDLSKNGTYSVRAKGFFTVHGVEQERIIKTEIIVNNGKITVHCDFTVQLSDHNIPIPKIVSEKLSNEIKIQLAATLQPRNG